MSIDMTETAAPVSISITNHLQLTSSSTVIRCDEGLLTRHIGKWVPSSCSGPGFVLRSSHWVLSTYLGLGLRPLSLGLICPVDLHTEAMCPFFWHLWQVASLNLQWAAEWLVFLQWQHGLVGFSIWLDGLFSRLLVRSRWLIAAPLLLNNCVSLAALSFHALGYLHCFRERQVLLYK